MIQFEHVSKSYGKTPVLKDLNFTIPDGQFVVLIGPSGCGKGQYYGSGFLQMDPVDFCKNV